MKAKTSWQLLAEVHPLPWYLEKCNNNEVCVKDSLGNDVFYEDLGSIPDEMPSCAREQIILGARSLAKFLVELSNKSTPSACRG